MHVAVVGSGYVGLVAGACLAETGNDVVCVDNDAEKIARLQRNEIPIYEPGLEPMVQRNQAEGRLTFLNASGAEILGWTEAELRGRSIHSVVHNQHADGSPHAEDGCPRARASSLPARVSRLYAAAVHRRDARRVP